MTHLSFLIWMLLYPLATNISQVVAVKWLGGTKYSDLNNDDRGAIALFEVAIWFIVGYILY